MLKDFMYELFGVRFYGLTFERIFFLALAVLGGVILYRAWAAKQAADAKKEEVKDLGTRMLVGVGLAGFGGYMGLKAWLADGYQLFFSEPLVLHTYGVAIATGFIFAIWFGVREARRTGLEVARIMDMAFWFLVAGLIGSRVVFMIVEWQEYYDMCFEPAKLGLSEADCLAPLKFWKGGLVFYGGLIGAMVAAAIYMTKYRLPAWRYVDAMAPSVAIGQFFGRLGCVSAGCCHGKYIPSERMAALEWPKDTPAWRVIIEKPEIAAEKAKFLAGSFVTAHPTQLYESGSMILLFLFLLWFRTRKSFNGQVVLLYVICYAFIRSFVEIFRGDTVRGFIFQYSNPSISEALGLLPDDPLILSTSQFISVLMAVGAAGIWIWRSRVAREKRAALRTAWQVA